MYHLRKFQIYSKNLTFEITFERHVVWGQQFSMAKFNPWMDDFFPIVGGKNLTLFLVLNQLK